MTGDGRIVDTGNGGISHSEGQAWAMFFAVHCGDKANFDLIHNWTLSNLCVRGDRLMAWRWNPEVQKVDDLNNASDGDVFHIWALLRAAEKWSGSYKDQAIKTASDLKKTCFTDWNGRTVLLPGPNGFVRKGEIVVNPSYYIYSAFKEIGDRLDDPVWHELIETGLFLDEHGRFGDWKLPADWLSLSFDGSIRPADGFPVRFGYEAIRVPIYLTWGGKGIERRLKSFRNFGGAQSGIGLQPAWVDLKDGSFPDYDRPPGFDFIYDVLLGNQSKLDGILETKTLFENYYDACLILLSALAIQASAV
jgi:endoglucanase